MATMAQSAANWRNTHTIWIARIYSFNHVVRSVISAIIFQCMLGLFVFPKSTELWHGLQDLTCVRDHSCACVFTRGLGTPTGSLHNIVWLGKTHSFFLWDSYLRPLDLESKSVAWTQSRLTSEAIGHADSVKPCRIPGSHCDVKGRGQWQVKPRPVCGTWQHRARLIGHVATSRRQPDAPPEFLDARLRVSEPRPLHWQGGAE